ncbi:MAG TPA: hypothetical protein VLA19_26765 [Herpetosiphonaceae bacterium]|nr:hypothetical protein [Herpetosiphonaceae bacterium]
MNDIIQRVQQDILDRDVALSDVLLTAKVLAYQLKNDELKRWVKSELDGYREEDLPDYRLLFSEPRGQLIRGGLRIDNCPVDTNYMPDELRDRGRTIRVCHGVGGIEGLARNDTNYFSWRQNWVQLVNAQFAKHSAGYGFLTIHLSAQGSAFAQILTTVRSRLLDFILEISEFPWDMSRGRSLPREEVQRLVSVYIYNNPEGGNVSVFDQRGQNVNYQYNAAGNINFGAVQNSNDLVAELEKLRDEVRKAAMANIIKGEVVEDTEYQLTKAITQAKKPELDKKALVDHLNTAKTLMESAKTAAGLVGGIVTAIEAVQKIWPQVVG